MSGPNKWAMSARKIQIAVAATLLLLLGYWIFPKGMPPKLARVLEIQRLRSSSDGQINEGLKNEYFDILNSFSDQERLELAQESHRAYIVKLNSFFKLPKEEQNAQLEKIVDMRQLSARQVKNVKSVQRRRSVPKDDSGIEFSGSSLPSIEYSTAERDLHMRYRRAILERQHDRSKLAQN